MSGDHAPSEQPVTWWLKHLTGLLDVAFDRLLEREGLAGRHWWVLNVVAGGAGTTEEVERAFTRMDRAAPAGRAALGELVHRGWVSAESGRLVVTPTGTEARERLLAAQARHRDRLTAGVPPEQYRTTVDTLRRMARNLAD